MIMEFTEFKSIIDKYDFNSRLKALHLYKQGEPLVNKKLPDMIAYAVDKDCADKITITTNGLLLTSDINSKLIKSGINKIVVSINGNSSDDYKNITNVSVDYQRLIDNIKDLYSKKENSLIFIKTTNMVVKSKEDEEMFYTAWGNCCDYIEIDNISPVWPNFAFDSKTNSEFFGVFGNKIEGELLVCPFCFYTMVINADSSVTPCCMDWRGDIILGTIKQNTLKEIWNNEKYNSFRLLQLRGLRLNSAVCKTCGMPKYASSDNIDIYRDAILKRMASNFNKEL
jgi:radical SAM protein with 4Fe4S-binding SPASM domain